VPHHPQCKLSFKEWLQLQEVGTGTNAVAAFARPIMGGPVTRSAPKLLVADSDEDKKRKKS
jgi:hypothetical protein